MLCDIGGRSRRRQGGGTCRRPSSHS